MFTIKHNGTMVARAAARVRITSLERQRTYKAYRQHLKDIKNSEELAGDEVFTQLRDAMQTAKENHVVAQTAYDTVVACPPAAS